MGRTPQHPAQTTTHITVSIFLFLLGGSKVEY